jgi:hypothetical protein
MSCCNISNSFAEVLKEDEDLLNLRIRRSIQVGIRIKINTRKNLGWKKSICMIVNAMTGQSAMLWVGEARCTTIHEERILKFSAPLELVFAE